MSITRAPKCLLLRRGPRFLSNTLTFENRVRMSLKLSATCFHFPTAPYVTNYIFIRSRCCGVSITRAPECLLLRWCPRFLSNTLILENLVRMSLKVIASCFHFPTASYVTNYSFARDVAQRPLPATSNKDPAFSGPRPCIHGGQK